MMMLFAGTLGRVTMCRIVILFSARVRQLYQSLFRDARRQRLGKILSRVFRVPNHANLFPINGERFSHVVPFLLPPAYDKLLGYDPVLDLWENLHRTLDSFSAIVIIGYSMPSYDSYAYETLGRLLIDYQEGGCKTYWDQRRVPVQVVSLDDSAAAVPSGVPFLVI